MIPGRAETRQRLTRRNGSPPPCRECSRTLHLPAPGRAGRWCFRPCEACVAELAATVERTVCPQESSTRNRFNPRDGGMKADAVLVGRGRHHVAATEHRWARCLKTSRHRLWSASVPGADPSPAGLDRRINRRSPGYFSRSGRNTASWRDWKSDLLHDNRLLATGKLIAAGRSRRAGEICGEPARNTARSSLDNAKACRQAQDVGDQSGT
jgi:hypothetical protein